MICDLPAYSQACVYRSDGMLPVLIVADAYPRYHLVAHPRPQHPVHFRNDSSIAIYLLAVRHPDGYVEVKDRSKDVIISGGENISSLEVEETLYRHPKVMEAAVVAKPDAKWGESPCAFVTLKEGEAAEAEEIIAFCRDNMAHYKAPHYIVFGPLPKTSTGKIQKYVLREQAKAV